jgi:hypothetical protein
VDDDERFVVDEVAVGRAEHQPTASRVEEAVRTPVAGYIPTLPQAAAAGAIGTTA